MRIIGYEIKKLLHWKILFLLLFISLVFFKLFLEFEFLYFPNGQPMTDHVEISKQMIEKYGNEMDETEFQDFKNMYKKASEKEDGSYEKGIVTGGFLESDSPWKLQAWEGIIESYERKKISFTNKTNKEAVLPGINLNSILPYIVYENYNNLIRMVTVLVIISVMIVTGRVFITDMQNNAMSLQYSTLTGRRLFIYKTIASMITSFFITAVYIGILLVAYAGNDTSVFFQSSLQSFDMIWPGFLIDLSFLQYIILTITGVFLLALVSAAITTFVSRTVSSYMSLIGAQVPVAAILILLILKYLISDLLSVRYPMFLTIGTYIVLLFIGAMVLFKRWEKEEMLDIG
ncbi:hypothetical protein ACOJQI_11550 [Bacillus salacetis]|uniref:hypothetical protein n=1 Tax=Bacillus salacetis TaxID=2315464 RepID=UPI003BA1CE26